MRTICLIQARLGSERLPGKVLMDICGKPMLERVYERACRIDGIDEVIVITSFSEEDRLLVQWCDLHGIKVMRGGKGENDVLGRYWDVATGLKAGVIMRVTGDCPCLDPEVSGQVLAAFHKNKAEYATNRGELPYPDGYDTQVFTYGLLSAAYWGATEASDREHVGPWMEREAEDKAEVDYTGEGPEFKVSVDTLEELEQVREMYAALGEDFGLVEAREWFRGREVRDGPQTKASD